MLLARSPRRSEHAATQESLPPSVGEGVGDGGARPLSQHPTPNAYPSPCFLKIASNLAWASWTAFSIGVLLTMIAWAMSAITRPVPASPSAAISLGSGGAG